LGAYTVDRLIAECTLRARRFVEDTLELGRGISALREFGRGAYGEALQRIGVTPDTARRLIRIADKFWGNDHRKPLLSLDTSKIYELALLDDNVLDDLASNPDKIDEYDRMSVSQLRAAMRESKAQLDAKDAVAEKNQKKIQSLQEKLARQPAQTPEFLASEVLTQLDVEALECAAKVSAGLRSALTTVLGAIDAHGADRLLIHQACSAAIGRVFAAARDLVADFDIVPQEPGVIEAGPTGDPIWDTVMAEHVTPTRGAKRNGKLDA
ncbi:MAG: hypothetical protein VB141_13020, partial [Burkholderia gladioli]